MNISYIYPQMITCQPDNEPTPGLSQWDNERVWITNLFACSCRCFCIHVHGEWEGIIGDDKVDIHTHTAFWWSLVGGEWSVKITETAYPEQSSRLLYRIYVGNTQNYEYIISRRPWCSATTISPHGAWMYNNSSYTGCQQKIYRVYFSRSFQAVDKKTTKKNSKRKCAILMKLFLFV